MCSAAYYRGGCTCSSKRVPVIAYWLGTHGLYSYTVSYRTQASVFVCTVCCWRVCYEVIIYRSARSNDK